MSRPAPHDWKAYSVPTNWFRFRYPPSWRIVETDKATLIVADGSTITIDCCRLDESDRPVLEPEDEIRARFPGSVARAVAAPESPYAVSSYEGVFSLKADRGGRILGGLMPRKTRLHWRLWFVRHKSLLLTIERHFEGQENPQVSSDLTLLLQSLMFAVEPAATPQAFAEQVMELAREKFPLLPCELSDELQLKLGESRINLFNFYRMYAKAPHRFREIVMPALATVVQVQEWGPDQTEPPLERVRDRIFPMLYPEETWRENFPTFIGTPWIADLMILYVVDEAQAYWYIRDDLPARWGLTVEELHELALGNLERHFDETPMEFKLFGHEDGPWLLMPERPDAYNATRILSGTFHRRLRELLGPELAVGIPSRDFFVAVSLDSDTMVEEVRAKVIEDYASLDHPVCNQLLLLSLDGISQFCAREAE